MTEPSSRAVPVKPMSSSHVLVLDNQAWRLSAIVAVRVTLHNQLGYESDGHGDGTWDKPGWTVDLAFIGGADWQSIKMFRDEAEARALYDRIVGMLP